MNLFANQLLQDAVTIFLGIVVEAIPFILLGVTVSAALSVFMKEKTFTKLVPKGRITSVLGACFLGVLMPVCECGNIPVARRLIQKGVPVHAAITFLLAAPVMNPIVLLATIAAFKHMPEIIWARFLFTFIIAFTIGIAYSFHPNPQAVVAQKLSVMANSKPDTAPATKANPTSKNKAFLSFIPREFFEMLAVLIPGAIIAALTQTIIPRETLLSIGTTPALAVGVMLALAFILSICANVDAFIALSYAGTFTPGALVAFLVFGPMIDIKALFMLRRVITTKTIATISLLALTITLLLVGIFQIFYP